MAKEFAQRFYNSKTWKECRKSFIAKRRTIDGGMCEHCKNSLGYIVDHIVELNPINISDPFVSLNHENLQYLCLVCHNSKNTEKSTRDDVEFDSQGMLVMK
jgi:5-methylcytosine-specific restriction endonuclease McrA